MKIGFISDTHGVLREEVLTSLEGCGIIFHAGDICSEEIIRRLQELAPVIAVCGNNDKGEWASTLPKRVKGEVGGLNYLMVHDKKDIPANRDGIDFIIYGHSHKYHDEILDGIHYLNPGSCGKKRFSLPLTMAIGEMKNGQLTCKKIMLNS